MGWLVGWGLTTLLAQKRPYHACKYQFPLEILKVVVLGVFEKMSEIEV